MQLTPQDRIQNNSRHRQHRNQRAKTQPGFWDVDFKSPEPEDLRGNHEHINV